MALGEHFTRAGRGLAIGTAVLAAVGFAGRMCAIGGRKLSLLQNLASFECYDPGRDAWQAMPDIPTARGGIGAAVVGDRIFVLGGEQPPRELGALRPHASASNSAD